MSFASVEELVEGLQTAVADLEPGCLSGSDATSLMRLFARARNIAAAGEGLCARRAAACAEWAKTGARSAEEWLAREAGSDPRSAGRVLDTMERLDGLDETADAFRRGEISAEQAAEVAAGAAKDPSAEKDLLGIARKEPMRKLRQESRKRRAAGEDQNARRKRHRRNRQVRHWVDDDGRGNLLFQDAADVVARINAIIRARADQLFDAARKTGVREFPAAYAADALVDLIERGAAGGGDSGGGRPVVSTVINLIVDHTATERGHAEPGETCEVDGAGPVTVSAVEEMAQEAFFTISSFDGTDVHRVTRPGRVGRERALQMLRSRRVVERVLAEQGVDVPTLVGNGRTIPAHLETALLIRDRTCTQPGCDVRHGLQVDHLNPVGWGVNGPTSYANLGRKCRHHHKLKTEHDRKQYAPRPPSRYGPPPEPDAAFADGAERGPPRTAA